MILKISLSALLVLFALFLEFAGFYDSAKDERTDIESILRFATNFIIGCAAALIWQSDIG